MHHLQSFSEKLTWAQARDEIKSVCEELSNIIDEISPSNNLKFIKVKYPFGAKIINNGLLNLPTNKGELQPLTDTRLPQDIRNELSYSLVPLGVIVKNGIEVHREIEDRVFSIASWGQGLDIGIWEYLGWTTPYSITSGARSLYMVPRITLTSSHKKLKRDYNVTSPPPKRCYDHWKLFTQIANSKNFPNKWYCEIIFFCSDWLKNLQQHGNIKNGGWEKLHNFLIKKNLQHSEYGRKRSIFEIVWELFSRSLNVAGLRPNPYVIDTLKHLVFIGTGGSPGSAPNTGSTELGPVPDLQKIYIDCYGLKDYLPTIMQPQYFSSTQDSIPIYYSLQSPTLLESVPKSRNLTSIVDNVRELKELTDHFLNEAFDEHLKIANTSINYMISKLQFDFFHEEAYAYGKDIRPSNEMPIKDNRLLYSPTATNSDKKFADTSSYLHGCVRISKKIL